MGLLQSANNIFEACGLDKVKMTARPVKAKVKYQKTQAKQIQQFADDINVGDEDHDNFVKIPKDEPIFDFYCDNFDAFVKKNWSALVEYAEQATGELYNDPCGEPLLTKDGIIDEAQEIWTEEISRHTDYSDYQDQEVRAINAQ